MPQVCSVCRAPGRIEIERALIAGVPLRTIVEQSGPGGPSKTALLRHREHISGLLARHEAERDAVRTATLLQDVRGGEQRAAGLLRTAEQVLADALRADDSTTALNAIKTAATTLAQLREFMSLRGQLTGELGRDRTPAAMCIQIVCPSTPKDGTMPRVSYSNLDTFPIEEIAFVGR